MKTYKTSRVIARRILMLGLTAATAAVPLAGATTTAQAAPVRLAQTYTRRGVGHRTRTYTGVVTRNYSENQFSMSLDRGGDLRVDARNIARGGFRSGDQVTVTGHYNADRSLFVATSVTVTSRSHHHGRRH